MPSEESHSLARRPRRMDGGPYGCPCRRLMTLETSACFEICPECGWEDDGQDDVDADEVLGGDSAGTWAADRPGRAAGAGPRGTTPACSSGRRGRTGRSRAGGAHSCGSACADTAAPGRAESSPACRDGRL
ncbi:CPCC family cysteine-rich protein [Streptomyces sp. NPDC060053]|uniref:CPCC family cysteine-rich protein n=1 Tax=Streptomyces sp. NPDC060053 TaxID=3347047 RepID=UPI00367FC800